MRMLRNDISTKTGGQNWKITAKDKKKEKKTECSRWDNIQI